jgi:hypothetical protein
VIPGTPLELLEEEELELTPRSEEGKEEGKN